MNTTEIEPTPPATGGADVGAIVIIIDVPACSLAALCLATPLRYIFAKALGEKLNRPPVSAPLTDSVGLWLTFASINHLQAATEIVRGELIGLGYESIAHVGIMEGDGWRCVHGRKERIRLFEDMVRESAEMLSFDTAVKRAHLAAVIRPLES